jgi:hypothetical protein
MRRGGLIVVVGLLMLAPVQASAAPPPIAEGDAGTTAAQDPTTGAPPATERSERRAEEWYELGEDAGPTYNCTILGGGYYEELGRAWGGWYGEIGVTPTVNQIYYVKAGWGVSGFPCGSGGAQVHVEMVLPAYTKLAISQQNPVHCFYDGLNSDFHEVTDGSCPQNPGTGYNGGPSFDPNGQATWPTASGTLFEIWVPVKTTQPLNGIQPPDGTPCNTCLYVGAWMIDGTYSPWVYPKVPIYVAGSGGPAPEPSVNYPAPATGSLQYNTGLKMVTARLFANVFTEGTGGTAQFEMGNKEGEYNSPGEVITIPTGGNWQAYEDWQMAPGHLYHWRLCYKPSGESKTCGPDQTVNAPPETGIAGSEIKKPKRKATFFPSATAVPNMTTTFECRMDKGKYKPCEVGDEGEGVSYSKLAKGKHTFYVRAVDQDGHADATPAKESFKL